MSKVLLKGVGASQGIVSGIVRVIHSPSQVNKVNKGDILVTEKTTPDFIEAFSKVVAVITDIGGITSHAAIVSREMGIPAVVGTKNATSILKTGQEITVDGQSGLIYSGRTNLEEQSIVSADNFTKESSGDEIEDLVRITNSVTIDVRELWPLSPDQLLSYIDMDQALDLYKKLKSFKKDKPDLAQITKFFKNPTAIRYFLLNCGLTGLKAAHSAKVGNITIRKQVEFVQLLIDIIKKLVREDPFCLKGKNLFWSENQVKQFLKTGFLTKPSPELKKAVNLFTVSLFTLSWSFYWDYFGADGSETHGPYFVSSEKFGKNSNLLIKDYFDLSPAEIWPMAKKVPFKSVLIAQVFNDVEPFISFSSRVLNQDKLTNLETHLAVLIDGKPVTDVEEIRKLTKIISQIAKEQTNYVNTLKDMEKVRKGAQLAYYGFKDFYLKFNKNWYPEKTVENTIHNLGDQFLKLKATRDLTPEEKFKLFDPRNYFLAHA